MDSQATDEGLSAGGRPGPAAGLPASSQDWAALASELHDRIVGLLTTRPELVGDLAGIVELAGRLRAEGERGLRESLERVVASERAGLREVGVVPRARRLQVADRLPLRADPGRSGEPGPPRYGVTGRSLHERAGEADRPPVSVSAEDYERIARTIESLCADAPHAATQAKRIREATGEAARTAPLRPRLVSLTHVYICLRLWQERGLIERSTGGWFRPVAADFASRAGALWVELELESEPGAP